MAGALTSLQKNYLNSITYAPHGAMADMQMGNNVWRVYSYNSRLQVQRIEDAVNNDPSRVLLDEQFEWGTNNNNGNLSAVTAKHGSGSQQMLTLQDHYWYNGVNQLSNALGPMSATICCGRKTSAMTGTGTCGRLSQTRAWVFLYR